MKQTDFAERLTQALDLRGLSAADLSRATGVSEGTISCYKKGKYQAKQNRVYDFARALRVDPAWLMGYDVPMEPQKQAAPQPTPIPPGFQPMPEMDQVPLIGSIACGTPTPACCWPSAPRWWWSPTTWATPRPAPPPTSTPTPSSPPRWPPPASWTASRMG